MCSSILVMSAMFCVLPLAKVCPTKGSLLSVAATIRVMVILLSSAHSEA
jgi:hypothetical protein